MYTIGSGSASDVANWGNRPVNLVSYWDSCRFANWLGNGQGNGDTENGAYTMTSNGIYGNTVTRNAGATWAVTNENEWYKAAYYKGRGTDAGYWLYPTQSNSAPTAEAPPGGNNSSNYDLAVGNRTNVGAYAGSISAYGTFDQGGNVSDWNEAIVGGGRGFRGGSYGDTFASGFEASTRCVNYIGPSAEAPGIGFRVVELVPEPASIIALLCGIGGMAGIVLRKRA